ncbi:MAG: hypothetical protein M3Q06_08020 [Bacteroidota bacterium]|nr:hypothetical protein [Bacteroidota bacterium]
MKANLLFFLSFLFIYLHSFGQQPQSVSDSEKRQIDSLCRVVDQMTFTIIKDTAEILPNDEEFIKSKGTRFTTFYVNSSSHVQKVVVEENVWQTRRTFYYRNALLVKAVLGSTHHQPTLDYYYNEQHNRIGDSLLEVLRSEKKMEQLKYAVLYNGKKYLKKFGNADK